MTDEIRVAIIDDEKGVREVLSELLISLDRKIHISGEANSVETGLEFLTLVDLDLVFLDIELSDGSGFELLEKLKDIKFKIIFVTAFNQYAIQAIKFSAFDYLLKPINSKELDKAIERYEKTKSAIVNTETLIRNLKSTEGIKRIAIPSVGKVHYIDIGNIIYAEAEGSYSYLFLYNKQKILSSFPLKEFHEMLIDKGFYRINRSLMVNLDKVIEYRKGEKDSIILADDLVLQFSRKNRSDFMKAMNAYTKHF